MIIKGMMIDVGSPALLALGPVLFAEVAVMLRVVVMVIDALPFTVAADVQTPVWSVTEAFAVCAVIVETTVVSFGAAIEGKVRQMMTRATVCRQAVRCIAMIVDGMGANI